MPPLGVTVSYYTYILWIFILSYFAVLSFRAGKMIDMAAYHHASSYGHIKCVDRGNTQHIFRALL
jgi:hypothetical protein